MTFRSRIYSADTILFANKQTETALATQEGLMEGGKEGKKGRKEKEERGIGEGAIKIKNSNKFFKRYFFILPIFKQKSTS